ncbi:MAG: transketolase C-terminal domain-containing protein, partial [Planctomycetota bacterium]
VTEEPEMRSKMHAKRMNKLALIDKEIPREKKVSVFGDTDARTVIVGWGTTKGAIVEAIEPLKEKGIKIKFVQIKLLHPFPKNEIMELTDGIKKIIVIESNITGQLASLLREATGKEADHYILKWTGRPISRTEVIEGVEKVIKENIVRLELKYGV